IDGKRAGEPSEEASRADTEKIAIDVDCTAIVPRKRTAGGGRLNHDDNRDQKSERNQARNVARVERWNAHMQGTGSKAADHGYAMPLEMIQRDRNGRCREGGQRPGKSRVDPVRRDTK